MRSEIVQLIHEKGPLRPAILARELGISTQALHRHLKKLVLMGTLVKKGVPPKVFYDITGKKNKDYHFKDLDPSITTILEEHYTFVSPDGRSLQGATGFREWTVTIKQQKAFESLARAYYKIRTETLALFTNGIYISALQKFRDTFTECFLNEVLYRDFYSLPQFGKSRLGQMVTQGKSGQSVSTIKKLADLNKPIIQEIIQKYAIDAIAWTPHSIPRKVVFLSEYRSFLGFNLPAVKLVKAFTGGIPIAQKSLKKLSERMENARTTLFINETNVPFKRVLIIDDAIGSGATMNEIASRLKKQFSVQQVFGFAIVGSYKGFEVIAEV